MSVRSRLAISDSVKNYFAEAVSEEFSYWATEENPRYVSLVSWFRREGRKITQEQACELAQRLGFKLSISQLREQEREINSSPRHVPAVAAALGLEPWALQELHHVCREQWAARIRAQGRKINLVR